MIVVDTSVFVAILQHEDDANTFLGAIDAAREIRMSAGNYLEAAMVASRRSDGRFVLDSWLTRFSIAVVPVDRGQAEVAAEAFARFGRGRHPAGLNYGDCFAYALARTLDAPLLFKGGDFARTDIQQASM